MARPRPKWKGHRELARARRTHWAGYPNHVFVSGEIGLSLLSTIPTGDPAGAVAQAWTIFNTALWCAARGLPDETPLESLKPEARWRDPLSSAYWIAGAFSTPPLLIIDEFDMVGAAPPIALNTLLHGLRAMLRGQTGSPAVAAIIVAGPPSILDIRTTEVGPGKCAGSPWNVTYASTPRRFDVADLRVLFDEPPARECLLWRTRCWRVSSHSRRATGAGP